LFKLYPSILNFAKVKDFGKVYMYRNNYLQFVFEGKKGTRLNYTLQFGFIGFFLNFIFLIFK